MSIFVVVQCGVYRHDIGPYALDLDSAIELAKQCNATEPDLYHRHEVLELLAGSLGISVLRAVVKGVGAPVCVGNKTVHYTTHERVFGEFTVERY